MSLEIRFVEKDEYEQAAMAIHELWAPNHVYCRDRALFDWTFGGRDLWEGDAYSFALAGVDGEVVGMLGGIPYVFNDQGSLSRGHWLANWIVREDARASGAGLQLLSTFSRLPGQTLTAFGINDTVAKLYRALRGQVVATLPRHLLVLPGAAHRMETVLRLAWPDWDGARANELAERLEYRGEPEAPILWSDALPPDWDDRAWAKRALQLCGAARDLAYLRWRYSDHPRFEYRFVIIPEADDYGLAVWRLELIHRQTDAGLEAVDTIARVVEFLPCSKPNAGALLGKLIADFRSADAFAADFYCHHGPTRDALTSLGFPLVDTVLDGEAIPSRFQPLDNRGGRIQSALLSCPCQAPPDTPSATCPWYWTKSDSDQDRPN